jgi:hypothetical protein
LDAVTDTYTDTNAGGHPDTGAFSNAESLTDVDANASRRCPT